MSDYGGYGVAGYGDGTPSSTANTLTFRVADTLTGRLIGTLRPSEWSWEDPLTGTSKGGLTIPLPSTTRDVKRLVDLTRPHACQIGAQDQQGRWWFGGPIIAEPAMADRQVRISFADWRAWFYAAARTTAEQITSEAFPNIEQMLALWLVAGDAITAAGAGAPHLVFDSPVNSHVEREVLLRPGTMVGAIFDDIALRDRGPDWYTRLETDPDDETVVVAHLVFDYPERSKGYGLFLRHRLGSGGNISNFTWPEGNVRASRIIGTHGTPPDQLLVTAQDPAVAAGDALAWDEIYPLPDGVDATSAFDYTLARLVSRQGFTLTADLDPTATDLGAWGPGDRARLSIDDGWRALEEPSVRVIARTLAGRGPDVTSVKVSLAVGEPEADIEPPTPVVI